MQMAKQGYLFEIELDSNPADEAEDLIPRRELTAQTGDPMAS